MKSDLLLKSAIAVVAVSMVVTVAACEKVKTVLRGPPAPIYSGIVGHSSVQRTDVLTLPENYRESSLAFSSDAKHYAYLVNDPDGVRRAVVDGVESQALADCSQPEFSPAGKPFFWGMKDGNVALSADGRIVRTPFARDEALVFSKDGARWATIGPAPAGGGDSSRVAVLFVDGVQVGRYGDVSFPEFDRDGKHYAFLFLNNGQMSLAVDGKVSVAFAKPKVEISMMPFPASTMFLLSPVRYLSDGGIVALAQDANGWTVFKNGKALGSYRQNVWGGGNFNTMISFGGFEEAASIQGQSLVVADDAPVAAWWERPAGKDGRWHVVVDGKPADAFSAPLFWSAEPPALSRDGKRLGYSVIPVPAKDDNANAAYVVIDGTKRGPYHHVWGIRFTQDSQHFAYAAASGPEGNAWSYYLDGKPFGTKYSSVYRPVFSSNGRHVAWQAERGNKQVLSVDGQDIATADEVLLRPKVEDTGATSWVVRDGQKVTAITTAIE